MTVLQTSCIRLSLAHKKYLIISSTAAGPSCLLSYVTDAAYKSVIIGGAVTAEQIRRPYRREQRLSFKLLPLCYSWGINTKM